MYYTLHAVRLRREEIGNSARVRALRALTRKEMRHQRALGPGAVEGRRAAAPNRKSARDGPRVLPAPLSPSQCAARNSSSPPSMKPLRAPRRLAENTTALEFLRQEEQRAPLSGRRPERVFPPNGAAALLAKVQWALASSGSPPPPFFLLRRRYSLATGYWKNKKRSPARACGRREIETARRGLRDDEQKMCFALILSQQPFARQMARVWPFILEHADGRQPL